MAKKATKKKTTPVKKATVKKVVETTIHKCTECGTEFNGKKKPCPKCHGSILRTRVERS